jgi:hypothetical protein
MRRVLAWFVLSLTLGLLAAPAHAQRAGSKYVEDTTHGFEFKPLKDWAGIPVTQELKASEVIARFSSETIRVKLPNNAIADTKAEVYLFTFETPDAVTGGEAGGLRSRAGGETRRPTIEEWVPRMFDFRDFKEEGLKDPILEPEDEKLKKGLVARHATYGANSPNGYRLVIDCWTIALDDFDLVYLYVLPDQKRDNKKWLKAFESSVKTLRLIEKVAGPKRVSQASSYEDQLAFHKAEAEKTPGWTAVETPTKNYIIKTSSDDKGFIKDVIKRLEASRRVFEQDFPPSQEMDHVSVVRVCKNQGEFSQYGNTRPGVAGYFNPGTTELVLYDNKNQDRRATLAVMSHEAFHQYCYFLFDRSEAHRWFDEGHGDFYGCYEFKGRKATPTAHMPGGLDRYQGAKTLVREEKFKPIFVHINYSHQQWQSQGPSNVSSYEQSWSIIHMLRMGALGKVSRKVWRDEYGEIIPNYIKVLHEGYQEAYAEQRAELEAQLEDLPKSDKTAELRIAIETQLNRPRVGEERKLLIWKAAMDASWGQVDIEEFEEHWMEFVSNHL